MDDPKGCRTSTGMCLNGGLRNETVPLSYWIAKTGSNNLKSMENIKKNILINVHTNMIIVPRLRILKEDHGKLMQLLIPKTAIPKIG